jgi:hypothetical protein
MVGADRRLELARIRALQSARAILRGGATGDNDR